MVFINNIVKMIIFILINPNVINVKENKMQFDFKSRIVLFIDDQPANNDCKISTKV